MPTVKVTLKGSFSQRSVSIDGWAVGMAGFGGEQSGEVTLSVGEHNLRWAATGALGAEYTIALSGDTADAFEDHLGLPGGRDAGSCTFKVK
jgi:hypothetical protein